MSRALNWEREGSIWPHRASSRFVDCGTVRWHVQTMGEGPPLLLLHGTGASCHSWRDVMPALAEHYTCIAPDLPGHAFSRASGGAMTLPRMARELRALLDRLELSPAAIVGHSAGAAIALQMIRDRGANFPVIGFNPALAPFPGLGSQLLPLMAKLLFVNPLVPRVFAGIASLSGETARFLRRSTNSRIDAAGLHCYEVLLGNAGHCRAALAMMANWDLEPLQRYLVDLQGPVLLVHSERDEAIPLASVRKAAERLPDAQLEVLPGLGHLAHEERPAEAAEHIRRFLDARAKVA
ncbi:alpha/beta fold hydrolase BchO [Erythrobacter sp. AP23]|uniref:alpha/beta fold hydrolase BchO n=1 Tax=Erythrobacter sp. AP23 TaxID=499656 RepID=UPI00076DB06A|nr:alpha/beta fold hydrolase BchO [Erythrobacter sp. AP23]KWV94489.1 alpha/beta hydrolase [Erythrobacter sp. AP23]